MGALMTAKKPHKLLPSAKEVFLRCAPEEADFKKILSYSPTSECEGEG